MCWLRLCLPRFLTLSRSLAVGFPSASSGHIRLGGLISRFLSESSSGWVGFGSYSGNRGAFALHLPLGLLSSAYTDSTIAAPILATYLLGLAEVFSTQYTGYC